MAPVSTNIKIDSELKKEAQILFEKMGLNMTTAVNMFLAQAVRNQAMPFVSTLTEEEKFYQKLELGRQQIEKREAVPVENVLERLENKYGL